jgi:hypothetical protein
MLHNMVPRFRWCAAILATVAFVVGLTVVRQAPQTSSAADDVAGPRVVSHGVISAKHVRVDVPLVSAQFVADVTTAVVARECEWTFGPPPDRRADSIYDATGPPDALLT